MCKKKSLVGAIEDVPSGQAGLVLNFFARFWFFAHQAAQADKQEILRRAYASPDLDDPYSIATKYRYHELEHWCPETQNLHKTC